MCVSCCPPWDQVRNNFNIEWEFQNLNKRQLVPSRWQTTAFLLNMRVEARFLGRASLLKMIPTMHAWIITPTIDWKYSQSLCSRGDGKVDRRKQQNPSGSRTKTRYQCQECVAGFPKVTPWAVACFLYLSQTQAKHFPLLCSVFCLFFFTSNKLKKNYPLLAIFFLFHVVFSFSQHHFNSRKHSALLSIFASQAWKQQISEEFKGQWCSNSIVWTEFLIDKVIHWLSKFWDVGCAPQTIDMDQDIMSGFLAAVIVVSLLTWYWQYERYHLKAHDSDRLRTFFGCLTPAVTDRVLRLHAGNQQFHQLSFALVNFFI